MLSHVHQEQQNLDGVQELPHQLKLFAACHGVWGQGTTGHECQGASGIQMLIIVGNKAIILDGRDPRGGDAANPSPRGMSQNLMETVKISRGSPVTHLLVSPGIIPWIWVPPRTTCRPGHSCPQTDTICCAKGPRRGGGGRQRCFHLLDKQTPDPQQRPARNFIFCLFELIVALFCCVVYNQTHTAPVPGSQLLLCSHPSTSLSFLEARK